LAWAALPNHFNKSLGIGGKNTLGWFAWRDPYQTPGIDDRITNLPDLSATRFCDPVESIERQRIAILD
jgi:hypothetical protein